MKCAWQALLNILPVWLRNDVDKLGKETLQEIRLRQDKPPELVMKDEMRTLGRLVDKDDLSFSINITSRYSPWAATTISKGYITAPGGHRVGIFGNAVCSNGKMTGIRTASSLCIRVARDFQGLADNARKYDGSVLIIGPPGSGKTTLLRDLIRQRSDYQNQFVSVVDEREEIFPYDNTKPCFYAGKHTDIVSGCGKKEGIDLALRNMTPETIAVDEITAQEDCASLIHAGWCGVKLLATAHAASREDLESRPIYKPLYNSGIFDTLIILQRDKSWIGERMNI